MVQRVLLHEVVSSKNILLTERSSEKSADDKQLEKPQKLSLDRMSSTRMSALNKAVFSLGSRNKLSNTRSSLITNVNLKEKQLWKG